MQVIPSLVLHFYLDMEIPTIARSCKVNRNDWKEKNKILCLKYNPLLAAQSLLIGYLR